MRRAKWAVAGTLLVLTLVPLVAFGVFISKVQALRRQEYAVLMAGIAEAQRSAAGLDSVVTPLDCPAESLRSRNSARDFFGANEVVTLVRGESADWLSPADMNAQWLPSMLEHETWWQLARGFVLEGSLKHWRLELQAQTVRQIGTTTTDLLAVVVPRDGLLRVEVRRYPTGEVLCRGTLEAPEKLEPRLIHTRVASALAL